MRVIKNGRYDTVVRTFEKEDFSLGHCGVQITPSYYLIKSNKELMIFDDLQLVDRIQI